MESKLSLYTREIPLKTPFKTALRTVESVTDLVLVLNLDGLIGYGSCAPTLQITGDSEERIIASLKEEILPSFGRALDPTQPDRFFEHKIISSPSARYMTDTALYDLAAKGAGQSLMRYLGGPESARLTSDITISLNEPEVMVRDAVKAISMGFRLLKVKVGNDLRKDYERLKAITEAIPSHMSLRIDANQAWSPSQAITIMNSYAESGFPIEFVEQPVSALDLKGLRSVTEQVPYPIMADESVFDSSDAKRIFEEHAADMINIKLSKCGGLGEAVRICELAKQYEKECMIGCMMEGPFGILAAAHLAAAKRVITRVDLDCPMLYEQLEGDFSLDFIGPNILINGGLGLGINDPALDCWKGERLWEVCL